MSARSTTPEGREYQVWWMTTDPVLGASFDTIGEAMRYARFGRRHDVWAIRKPDGRYFLGSERDIEAVEDVAAITAQVR